MTLSVVSLLLALQSHHAVMCANGSLQGCHPLCNAACRADDCDQQTCVTLPLLRKCELPVRGHRATRPRAGAVIVLAELDNSPYRFTSWATCTVANARMEKLRPTRPQVRRSRSHTASSTRAVLSLQVSSPRRARPISSATSSCATSCTFSNKQARCTDRSKAMRRGDGKRRACARRSQNEWRMT